MGQKVMVILSWINPSQNTPTKVNNIVLNIPTNRWLAWSKFRPQRQKVLQFQVFGLKKSRPKAFHSPCDNLHAVMGKKVMVILSWINPRQNIRTRVNNIVLKIHTNRRLCLNKFRPKRQNVLQFQVFGLKKSRPKAFHSPCDYLHAVMGPKFMVILSWINPRQNTRTNLNNIVLKILTNHWLGLNKFRPKRQNVLQFQVFGLKKSRPKVFHSQCDN
jgi:hypothetical protein